MKLNKITINLAGIVWGVFAIGLGLLDIVDWIIIALIWACRIEINYVFWRKS